MALHEDWGIPNSVNIREEVRNRQEVEEFIQEQLLTGQRGSRKDSKHIKTEGAAIRSITAWHYGRCELKDLMDYIYGEES